MSEGSETEESIAHRQVRACPECGSTKIIRDYEAAEIVCIDCGYVVAEKIATSTPEWRAFDEEQRSKRARVGAPLTYMIHDKGLSTVIDWRDSRGTGKEDDVDKRMEVYRLRKWQRRARVLDATERNLAIAFSELNKFSTALNLPKNILETASVIYRKAMKKRLIRGRSIHNVTAAAVYMSCRQCGIPRTLEEIAGALNLSKKDVGRSYRFMVRELGTFVPPLISPQYAARFSNKLYISGKAEAIAIKILQIAKNMKLTGGRGPTGIAAAATYIATVLTNERKTQREIAEIANVTEVTIRNRYKELLERLYIEVPL
ncbi:MAG: transcription initiation factor IIB [Candidatus Bathyarchaeia archaeon]